MNRRLIVIGTQEVTEARNGLQWFPAKQVLWRGWHEPARTGAACEGFFF